MSETSSSACSMKGTPRKMTSGGTTDSPVCSDTVATTMKMPSADSIRRSRRATSAGFAAVDEDHARRLAVAQAGTGPVDLHRQPVLGLKDGVRVDADGVGELGVEVDALVAAVDRHHVARPHKVEHELELLGEAVPGGVDGRVAGRHDLAADVIQAIDG